MGGTCGDMMAHAVIWWVYLDYSVSSGPFLRFSMRFEFLYEMFDYSVCETRDPSLTIMIVNDLFILCLKKALTFMESYSTKDNDLL